MEELNTYTKEELEEAKKEEMRELLMDAFEGKSVLYEIYKRRGWLDRLFTDSVLSMDKDTLYTNKQVADICETKDYVIKNKRRELLDYINPVVMGDGNTKIYKHNYISVFKLKMIDGLTGEGSEYTIPQIKELIYGTPNKPAEVKSEGQNDLIFQLMKRMEQFENFAQMVQSDAFYEEISNRAQAAAQKMLQAGAEDEKVKQEVVNLYDKIISAETAIDEKQQILEAFHKLEAEHPEQAFTIRMYKNMAEDRITKFKQDEREIYIRKLKLKVIEHMETYEQTESESEREVIREQLNNLAKDNPDLNYEIRMWLSSLNKNHVKKKGFWGRLFS